MTHQELWHTFCEKESLPETTPYEAWAFGSDPDGLAKLVLAGIKTATASGYALYAQENEPMPQVGDYSVVLDSRDNACCVIRTTKVYAVPFSEVGAAQAWLEGEGDRSLSYWRRVHWDFFTEEFAQAGLTFDESCLVLCEEFEVLATV